MNHLSLNFRWTGIAYNKFTHTKDITTISCEVLNKALSYRLLKTRAPYSPIKGNFILS